ncbi:MAG: class II D-tagatose-bisphosphate aldolase, non-catalytic subunit [Candidatus Sumerlaeota bacterium]|nr:class II D-tagatose-bisphosphate aldolase, non-catalytic subunit [Candidatus Sumerlaeota bacterium]
MRQPSRSSPLLEVVAAQKRGEPRGMYSLCSANRFVLEAGMLQAMRDRAWVCIEATSNQVNQFGGYSGLTPERFVAFVEDVARSVGFPVDRLLLGGDHLGPNVWRHEPAEAALTKARELVQAFVRAGFSKLHLDASMPCADDFLDGRPYLDVGTAAARTGELCEAAEAACLGMPDLRPARYVVGTEVPRAGGLQNKAAESETTQPADAEETVALTREAFAARGLEAAWERVAAVVVQPGVEFGDDTVIPYDRAKTRALSRWIERSPQLVYEAHSTDYQTRDALKQMVEDHFALLKVGPWLTFALREALFALAAIEEEWLARSAGVALSNLPAALDEAMRKRPEHWIHYYRGEEADLRRARKYSFSDRSRYYWGDPAVQGALSALFANLRRGPIPLTLLSQFLPVQYDAVRSGRVENTPKALVLDKIMEVTARYAFACGDSARHAWLSSS